MSERQVVIQKNIGYSWSITVKKTTRTPKEGSKYDDVTETEAKLSGNEDTFDQVKLALQAAKIEVNNVASGETVK